MRVIVIASLLAAACAGGTPSPARPTAPAPAVDAAPASQSQPPSQPQPQPQQQPKPPSDAEITKLSHDLLDAYDRGDVAALEAGFAPEFLHFEGGKPTDRAEELEMVRKRKPTTPTIAKRTWEKESVRATADSAVFVGKATEQQGGNESKGGYQYVGWYLLEWVRTPGAASEGVRGTTPLRTPGAASEGVRGATTMRKGDAWKARLWTWQRAGIASERETWNEIFRNGLGFARQPNRLLVEVVKGKKAGAALDVAMGQGRNALHLAAQGWKVTGVDISDEGIRMAREEAAKRKLALETVNANIDQYDFGKNRWDLVTMIYAGNEVAWIEKIKPSLKPGGLFVVEYFANDGVNVTDGFAPGQLAKLFATGFEIVRDEVIEDVPDWAMDRAKLVRFVAKKR